MILNESDIDKWFENFIERQEKPIIITDDIIDDLARSLCDDIPLGYDASHRLATLLFYYINKRKSAEYEIERSKEFFEKYNSKMLNTMQDINDLRTIFIDLYSLFNGEIDC